jgi:hypothetical protein
MIFAIERYLLLLDSGFYFKPLCDPKNAHGSIDTPLRIRFQYRLYRGQIQAIAIIEDTFMVACYSYSIHRTRFDK